MKTIINFEESYPVLRVLIFISTLVNAVFTFAFYHAEKIEHTPFWTNYLIVSIIVFALDWGLKLYIEIVRS